MALTGNSSLKNLKLATISLIILDFIVLILNLIMIMNGNLPLAKLSALILFHLLIPITGFFIIFTGISNLIKANTEKRTIKQELNIKQRFWGRMSLLGISVIIMFIYIVVMPLGLDLYGIISMFLLFILSICLGPIFGRAVIKK